MIIGLDLDGVIIDWDGGWRKLWNSLGRVPYVRSHSRTWNSPFVDTRLSHEEFWKWIDDTECYVDLPPVADALDHVRGLAERHSIVFVTQRHARAKQATRIWLRKHGLDHLPLVFTYDKSVVGAHAYVDDSPKVLRSLVRQAPNAKIYRQVRPWNRPTRGTTSIRSLKELL